MTPGSVDEVRKGLADNDYLAGEGLATSIFLALRLQRPLLLEGEAGVGKTEVGKVLARWTGGELVRLQCYEGIDAAQAVYEWDYSRQLLHLRAQEARHDAVDEDELYTERFLVKRPLLRALAYEGDVPPVLLIDEIDRADDEFEAFLLELLSDWSISVPELGVVRAEVPPIVVLTSKDDRPGISPVPLASTLVSVTRRWPRLPPISFGSRNTLGNPMYFHSLTTSPLRSMRRVILSAPEKST